MTVQIDTGPGEDTYESTKYRITVNGDTVYCYGHAEASDQPTVIGWALDEVIEQSWCLVNSDETVTVVVSLADDTPITTANVWPRYVTTNTVADGVLTIVMPANTRLHIETNGDRGSSLQLWTAPPLTTPVANVDYTTLGVEITSMAGTPTIFTAASHGFADGARVLIKSDDTRPAVGGTELAEYEIHYVDYIDADTFRLSLTDGGTNITLSDTGAGTITAVPAEWTDSVNALVFPSGVHKIGRLFKVEDDCTIYLEAGAVVIGSFNIRLTEGALIDGRGLLYGGWANYTADVRDLSADNSYSYAMIVGNTTGDTTGENSVRGIVVAAAPFYVNYFGVWSFRNVHVVSCWHGESDGLRLNAKLSNNRRGECIDCFVFSGDDAIHIYGFDSNIVTGCFAISTANTPYMIGYFPEVGDEYTFDLTGNHAMHLGGRDTEGVYEDDDTVYPYTGMNSIIKAWCDGHEAQTALGFFNYNFIGLRIWGEMRSRLLSIGNRRYPFLAADRDQAGQLANWLLRDIVSEEVPQQASQILSRDAENHVDNIRFEDIVLGGIRVDSTNYSDFFEVSEFATNLIWDEPGQGTGSHTAAFFHQEGKNNPYPPGFNYPNHYATPSAYQPFEGTGLLPMPRIGVAPGIALQLHESLGEPVYVAQCAIPSSGVGVKSVYPTDTATTPFAWMNVKDQQSWSPNAGGAFSRFQDVIASTVTALTVEENTGQCSGIFWVGGQEDASYENMADNYYVSLGTLVREMRKAVKDVGLFSGPASSIPFVHAKVKESLTYATTVNAAIEQLCGEDPFMACYEVEDLTLMDDGTSYDGAGQSLASERAFAAWQSLNNGGSTQLEICNLALANIGDSGTVTSLDPPDGSYQATICNAYWSIALNKTLQRHDWDFSVRRTVPTAITSDRAEWDFCYVLPADFAGVVGVLPEGAKDDTNVGARKLTRPYAAELDAHGVRRLYTNEENATLRYNAKVYDLSKWSESARIALSWMLAALIAPPIIKGEKGMEAAKSAYQMFEFHFMQAAVFDTSSTRDKTQDEYRAIWDEGL